MKMTHGNKVECFYKRDPRPFVVGNVNIVVHG